MRVWIVTVGEPLPTDSGSPRLLRTGLLANLFRYHGHDVVWWTSNFDHQAKRMRATFESTDSSCLGYEIRLLRGCGYVQNISFRRILDHLLLAAAFKRQAPYEMVPDIILSSYPTIELCNAVLDFARVKNIPVVVDIRDLWPDIFINVAPNWAKVLMRTFLYPMMRASRRVCSRATAITGITEAFVDWGLARAGRSRHDWDRSYPLAYFSKNFDSAELANARLQWDSLGLGSGQPIVCFFGTLGNQFDIPCLIAAARMLINTPLKIVVCGVGDRLHEYRNMALDLPLLYFPGWVDGPAINVLMERSIAGLAPYYNEMSFTMSIPNKIIEYLSGGLPVVTTLNGEVEKLLNVNKCGIFVPEGDPFSLSNALRSLLTDPLMRKKMACNAINLYKRQFVAEEVYGRFIQHLELIASQNPKASN